MKLLFAEDTQDLSRAVCAVLNHEGYEVDAVYDGQEALDHVLADSYDAIVLDIMMPKLDGLQVLTEIRRQHIITPVLLLTAKTQVDDRVTGLDAGADDYLTKPFAMKELLARIRALTRRRTDYSDKDLSFGGVRLNADSFELSCENSVRLSIKEFELMQVLITSAGRPLDTRYLLEHVWNGAPEATEQTVWLYISYLKGKLRAIASDLVITGEKGGSFVLSTDGEGSL